MRIAANQFCSECADRDNRSTDLFEQIRALYYDLALHPEKDFGWNKGKENARHLGYDQSWLEHFSASVWESAAAVGNPFSLGPPLKEAFRVLKLAGRIHIADMIRDESALRCESVAGESWADCIGGTLTAGCFLQMLADIGFVRAGCVKTPPYRTSASTIGALFFAQKPSK